MSEYYAIKDTTLTAIGDAVRSKVIGTTDISYTQEEYELDYMTMLKIDLPSFVKKVKIIGHYHHKFDYGDDYFPGYQGLGYATGINYNYIFNVKDASDYTILFKGADTYQSSDFEIIINSNQFTFVATKNDSSTMEIMVSFEAIYLDENGNEFKYTPLEMADTINGLMTIPDSGLTITGACNYRFAYNSWNWFINMAGDKITTNNITDAGYLFSNSTDLENIPFDLNLNDDCNINNLFQNCQALETFPMVNIEITKHLNYDSLLLQCTRMREVPEWLSSLLERDYNIATNNTNFGPWKDMLNTCFSLRTIPNNVIKYMTNPNPTGKYYTLAYSKPLEGLICLDELNGIPCDNYAFTSNEFNNFFTNWSRAKEITFETNEDNTPMVRAWKSQTIDLSSYIGYLQNFQVERVTSYNSGITADKEVVDDATYQALKNDPDWFTENVNYSRYNHNSAVNTINSLPDCSASGGTNTIKFKGTAGALTDGGAINTLTEEEIAVATAKGWTVSLV